MLKIQSISDIITNSSSEVFCIYTKQSIDVFKNLISILIGRDFDNVFVIEYKYSYLAEVCYNNSKHKDLDFEDYCLKYNNSWEENGDEPPFIDGISLKAINKEDEGLASAITSLLTNFEYVSIYC